MAHLSYTGDAGRYYPDLGLTPEPGGVYDLATDPDDGRWSAADAGVPAQTTPAEQSAQNVGVR